eukprot:COSAG04_NODE_4792_length_1892_cov_1.238706_3_plen_413_part_01
MMKCARLSAVSLKQVVVRGLNGGADGYQCYCATSSFFMFLTGVLGLALTVYGAVMACRGCSGLYIERESKDPITPLMAGEAGAPAAINGFADDTQRSENPVADPSAGADPVTAGSAVTGGAAALDVLMRCHAQAERRPLAAGALALMLSAWMVKWSQNMWWEWLWILLWSFFILTPCFGPCLVCLPCFKVRKVDADAGRRCNCTPKCCCSSVAVVVVAFAISEFAGAMWLGCDAECEVEGFFGDYAFSQGTWEPVLQVQFEPVHREVLSSEYFGLYSDFLQQPFAQPCAIGNAVDALMGPTGVLREALKRNHDHWDMDDGQDDGLDFSADYLKRFVAARFDTVQQLVEAKCDSLDGGCATGATCLTMTCPVNTTCVQGSLVGSCVGPDDCGCAAYSGWSKGSASCTSGGQTDE